MKKGKVTVKVGEGDAKEELVGLSKTIASKLNMKVKVKVKKGKSTVKKREKVKRKKG